VRVRGKRGYVPLAENSPIWNEVKLITPPRHSDSRGYFSETWNRRRYAELGIDVDFVQDNHSLSRPKYTLRGLHFQVAPFGQGKLVRVLRGAILDVAVDLRPGSPTYGQHVSAILSEAEGTQIYIPLGFAHGFLTLEPHTEVAYKVTDYYSAPHDRGLLWNDPALGIDWGVDPASVAISEKDRVHPPLSDLSGSLTFDREEVR
jgi:dTDP-4-dehydrorhamnose 3,5-epimerase